MYLSRVALDSEKRETIRALSQPQVLHGMIESGFKGERQRSLWRVDSLNGTYYLLILSEIMPEFENLARQIGIETDSEKSWQTKDYTPLLSRIATDQVWQFRLKANPIRNVMVKSEKGRGKVMAHVTVEQQRKWLIDRAERCGFTLNEDDFEIVNREWLKFKKSGNGHVVTLKTATFEGVLAINDSEKFKSSLMNGVGRAKAYGCGLLTIASVKKANSHEK